MKKIASLSIAALLGTTALAVPAFAGEGGKSAGDLMVRGRIIAVQGDESSTIGVIGGHAEVSTEIVPELDFSYFLTDNLAVELILATTKHDVDAKATDLGNVDLGSVWVLPPTLTLQYHFDPKGDISPYVGAGVNYTMFYNEDLPAAVVTDIDYDDSFGWALQAGVDFKTNDTWYFNVDVKKLFLNTDVSINGGAITADVDLDPWVFGIGFGRLF
ncbi:MAG: OmpW family protein [Alphaproteobacteria bacterium]|nr:MAG: OmpW family protein [Alphaproteobacteria bacterium]